MSQSVSDTESELEEQEIAENLMNIELDHECEITYIESMPVYDECIHADAIRTLDKVRCVRCEIVVNVIDQTMPQNEAKKMKFDEDYVQNNKHIQRLQQIVKRIVASTSL
jgi:hypothetical protein